MYNDIDLFACSNAALKHCSRLLDLDLANFQHIFYLICDIFNKKVKLSITIEQKFRHFTENVFVYPKIP